MYKREHLTYQEQEDIRASRAEALANIPASGPAAPDPSELVQLAKRKYSDHKEMIIPVLVVALAALPVKMMLQDEPTQSTIAQEQIFGALDNPFDNRRIEELQNTCATPSKVAQPKLDERDKTVMVNQSYEKISYAQDGAEITLGSGVSVDELLICGMGVKVTVQQGAKVRAVGIIGTNSELYIAGAVGVYAYAGDVTEIVQVNGAVLAETDDLAN